MTSIGEPVAFTPLIRSGEGGPVSDPGSSAGSPVEIYDGDRDAWDSVREAYRVIRERVASGGAGWEPKT